MIRCLLTSVALNRRHRERSDFNKCLFAPLPEAFMNEPPPVMRGVLVVMRRPAPLGVLPRTFGCDFLKNTCRLIRCQCGADFLAHNLAYPLHREFYWVQFLMQ